ncbi:MAG: RNA-binding protein S4 [Micrococcales bacterium]|nr:MAG: RNA-binding protein S4 [Micrococcales bacterium]PIE26944.1 MAG: RNA-binding protein S4 [Micrococcales bacterium]
MARLDAWLWSVRLYKTRSMATKACRGGHVRVNGALGKPSQAVAADAVITVRKDGDERVVRVLDPSLAKRVGAPVAQQAYQDLTPPKPPQPVEALGALPRRDRGTGRPTKRDRRLTDRLRGRG